MKKNKVIAELLALPPKEFRRFGKFVRNPANNKKETLIRLYQFVVKNHPDYEEHKFTKTQCFLHVFPELEYQYERLNGKADEFVSKKLKNPLYEFKTLIEDFIIQQELAKRSHEKTILLIKGLFDRQMHDKAFELIDKELKRLEGMVGDDFYHHFYQFQLLELKQDNIIDKANIDHNIYSDLIDSLDLFFVHTKIRHGIEILNRSKLFGEDSNLLFFDEVKKAVKENLMPNVNYSIQLYDKISDLNEDSSLEAYLEIKNFYFNNLNKLCNKEYKEPLIYLLNFSVYAYKKGESAYMQEMFDLFKFGLENDILNENGQLSPVDFKNIVSISIRLKKYDFVNQFVETKTYLLPEYVRTDMVLMARANIASSQQDFLKVIELLSDITFHNVYDNVVARALLMRSYYELDELSVLESFLESYDKFIRRNKAISNEVKTPLINMIKFTKRLCNIKFKTGIDKEKLVNKLNSFEVINSKVWLKKKISELK